MEWLVLGAFCAALLLCVALGQSILYALAAGFVLFLLYGRRKGFAWSRLFRLALDGVLTVKNILITFLLIGMLTALWRQAGTIPVIVCFSARLIRPALFVVMAFLLNCLVSFLTGTSFGTAATMGVICAAIGSSLGLNQLLVGDAVLSGVYFGDRCSPVSTSALLVSELTRTDVFHNIRSMVRSALVPFLLSCGVYGLLGVLSRPAGEVMDLEALFAPAFSLSWLALIPALVILALSLMQVNVKIAMSASILSALPVCPLVQHAPIADLPRLLFFGYRAADSQLGAMLNGGGIWSMARVTAIVCLSSSYSGIFQQTGLLDHVKAAIGRLARRAGPYAAILAASIPASMVACNQTLSILLTHQLCDQTQEDREQLALDLEDAVVVVAPLVPWSIAGGVPLASIAAPTASIFFACYLYLLPLWRLSGSLLRRSAHK